MINPGSARLNAPQKIALWATLLLTAFYMFDQSAKQQDTRGQKNIFIYDVNNYYSYLPAFFLHNDLSFSYPNTFWMTKSPITGNKIAKGTMGMSIMYAPFFGIGYVHALITEDTIEDYSPPFDFWIHTGTFIYALLAAYFLMRCLMLFFKPLIAMMAYGLIFFGTNYFYYVMGIGELPHSYLFFLFSLIIWLTIRWHQTEKKWKLLTIALLSGMITLIRPTDAVIVLFPFLYGIYSKESFKNKLALLGKNWKVLLLCVPVFFLPLLPQMIYWKIYAGTFLFYSYGSEEGFFFNDPQIANVLWSYRKGWFVYTPMAVFLVLGLIPLWKKTKELALPITLIFLLTLYVVSCWWDWWFGGCFGHRAFVQYYALLIFPLAALLNFLAKKWWRFLPFAAVAIFLINLNIKQSAQFRHNIIHWDSMTKEAYWYIWGKSKVTLEDYANISKRLKAPDYEAARKGERD